MAGDRETWEGVTCVEVAGALQPRAVGEETRVRCAVGDGARDDAADEEAVEASSDSGE